MQDRSNPDACRITHEGIVQSVEQNCISVRILQHSACDMCRAKFLCAGTGHGRNSVVEAYVDNLSAQPAIVPGSTVLLQLEQGMAWVSVVLAFALPLALLLTSFFITLHTFESELIAGLAGLAVLVPYYLVLGLNRDRLARRVYFTATPARQVSV